MTTNPCQAFFEQHAQTEDKSAALTKTGQAIKWEALPASRHSPGPVQDPEQVLRIVVNPIHVDPSDGSLKPTLMQDVKTRGGSVQRLSHVAEEAVIAAGRALAEAKNAENAAKGRTAPPRSVHGTVKLSVEEVRRIVVATNNRAFGVYDTAKHDDRYHADILLIVPEVQEWRSARLQLMVLADKGFQRT